MQRRSI
nr:unnamed protein product [Callosobruchus analis]CAI5838180.1 unnamed protein product [Callosobruchus analis]CAI5839843.1 unnamed protein product [Callosobruchus analis]CAI5843300.1 unnamed protein product [Callosobruchus analis]